MDIVTHCFQANRGEKLLSGEGSKMVNPEKISTNNTVIYDAECRVCRFLVEAMKKHDRNCNITYTPSDRIDFISRDLLKDTIVYIDDDTTVSTRAGALSGIFRRMAGVWNIPGYIISRPIISQIADVLYRLFARHRHTISKLTFANRARKDP